MPASSLSPATPPSEDFLTYSPDDIVAMGREEGRDAAAIAKGLKRHQENLENWGRTNKPEGYWKGAIQLEQDTQAALDNLRQDQQAKVLQSALPDARDQQEFIYQMEATGYDPAAVDYRFRPLARKLDEAWKDPVYESTTQRLHGGKVDVNGTTLARYALRRGRSDGKVDVNLVYGDKDEQTSIQVDDATDDDVAKEIQASQERAVKAQEEANKLMKGAQSYWARVGGSSPALMKSAAVSENRRKQEEERAQRLKEGGQLYLIGERVREQLKKPEWRDKVGEYAGWTEFSKGLLQASITTGAAWAGATGDQTMLNQMTEGMQNLNVAYPGSTRRELEGGVLNKGMASGQQALGQMAPFVLGGFAARGLGVAAGEAEIERQLAGRLGVAGMGMSVSAAGGGYVDTQLAIQEALSKGDQATADRIKKGQHWQALFTGLSEGLVERLGAAQALNFGGRGFRGVVKNILQEGAEEPLTGLIQRGAVDPLTIGRQEDVFAPMPEEAVAGLVAAGPLVGMSSVTNSIMERLKRQQSQGQTPTATEAEDAADAEVDRFQQAQNAANVPNPETLKALQAQRDLVRKGNKGALVVDGVPVAHLPKDLTGGGLAWVDTERGAVGFRPDRFRAEDVQEMAGNDESFNRLLGLGTATARENSDRFVVLEDRDGNEIVSADTNEEQVDDTASSLVVMAAGEAGQTIHVLPADQKGIYEASRETERKQEANTGRARMAEKILIRAGVEPDVAAVMAARLTDQSDPNLGTEEFRDGILSSFEQAGGVLPGSMAMPYVEQEAAYTAQGYTAEQAAEHVNNAKAGNARVREEARLKNRALIESDGRRTNDTLEMKPSGSDQQSPSDKVKGDEAGQPPRKEEIPAGAADTADSAAPEAKSSRKKLRMKLAPRADGVPDILDWLGEQGAIERPPPLKRDKMGRKLNQRGEHDGLRSFRESFPAWYRAVTQTKGRQVDVLAQVAYEENQIDSPDVDTFLAAIQKAFEERRHVRAEGRAREKEQQREERAVIRTGKRQDSAWAKANKPSKGDVAVASEDMVPGMELDVDGELMTVLEVEYDEDGNWEGALLEDGDRYGRQWVPVGELVYAEEVRMPEGQEANTTTEPDPFDADFEAEATNEPGGIEQMTTEEYQDYRDTELADKQRAKIAAARQRVEQLIESGDVELRDGKVFGLTEEGSEAIRAFQMASVQGAEVPSYREEQRRAILDAIERGDPISASAFDALSTEMSAADPTRRVPIMSLPSNYVRSGEFYVANTRSEGFSLETEEVQAGQTARPRTVATKPPAERQGTLFEENEVDFNLVSESKEDVAKREKAQADYDAEVKAREAEEARQEMERQQQRLFDDSPDNDDTGGDPGVMASVRRSQLPRQQTGAGPIRAPGQLVALADIRKHLLKVMGLPTAGRGRFRERALGIWKMKAEAIRLKALNDIATLTHEVGHAIHQLLLSPNYKGGVGSLENWKGRFDGELMALGQVTSTSSYTRSQVRAEGVAEFTRLWLTDPAAAMAAAPQFAAFFSAELKKKNPLILDGLNEGQKMIADYIAMPDWQKAKAQIAFDPASQRPRRTVGEWMRGAYATWVNTLQPAQDVLKKAVDINGRLAATAERINTWMENHRGGWQSKATGDLNFSQTDLQGKVVGKSLKAILANIHPSEIEDFSTYLAVKRARELQGRGLTSGFDNVQISPAEMKAWEAKFEATRQQLLKFQDNAVRLLLESGLLTAEAYQKMKEANRDYTPFYRMYEGLKGIRTGVEAGRNAGGYVDVGTGLRRIKGSDLAIVDPLQSIIRNVFMFRKLAEQNHIGVEFFGLLQKMQGYGQFADDIVAKKTPTKISHEEVVKKMIQQGVIAHESELPVDADLTITLWRAMHQPDPKTGEVIVHRNGQPEHWEVKDPLLYNALKSADADAVRFFKSSPLVTKILTLPVRMLRFGATGGNPLFALRNWARDQVTAGVNSQTGYRAFVDGFAGALKVAQSQPEFLALWQAALKLSGSKKQAKPHADYVDWVNSGGKYSGLTMSDPALKDLLEGILPKDRKAKSMMLGLMNKRHILRALTITGEILEEATRVQEFSRARRKGLNNMEAANVSKTISMNFARAGEASRALNLVIAFFNAGVQDLDMVFRQHLDPKRRGSIMMKGLVLITLPSLLAWALGKDDEEIQNLPDWRKTIFWNFNIGKLFGGDRKFILSMPKPFLMGQLYGTMVERALDQATARDPNGVKKALAGLLENSGVRGNIMDWLPTAMVPLVELAMNRDTFREMPVVPDHLANLPAESQFTLQTSETAKMIGGNIGVSPLVIDHLVEGHTAGLGKLTTGGIDWLLTKVGAGETAPGPSKDLMEYQPFKSFIGSPYEASVFVSRFYSASKDMEGVMKRWNQESTFMTEPEQERYWAKQGPEILHYSQVTNGRTKLTLAGEVRKVRKEMGEINTAMKLVQASRDMSPEEKRAKLMELSNWRNDLAKDAFTTLFPEAVRKRHY